MDQLGTHLVVDIDGVIADCRHREDRLPNWEAFFAGIPYDMPMWETWTLVEALRASQGAFLVLLTGRPERTRDATEAWLDEHGFRFDLLVMRPDHSRAPADLFKMSTLRALGLTPELVILVVDDSDRICRRLSGVGYRCLRAGYSS